MYLIVNDPFDLENALYSCNKFNKDKINSKFALFASKLEEDEELYAIRVPSKNKKYLYDDLLIVRRHKGQLQRIVSRNGKDYYYEYNIKKAGN